MRIRRLHLKAFGPFTDKILELGGDRQGLVVVHGVNETGKSSALRAISDLLFGIPQQSRDNFMHAHGQMRLGGEFEGTDGAPLSLVRRKGRGPTLSYADFALDEPMLDKAVPPEVEVLLTHGLTKDAYDSMFGLDHQRLREGGEALLEGEGEIGAALFEASAGVKSIPAVLEQLDTSARKFYVPGARGRNAKINEGLAAFDAKRAAYQQAQVRPAQWADLFRHQQDAKAALDALESRRREVEEALAQARELRAVIPLLASLDSAAQTLQELEDAVLLPATAEADRKTAEAGLSGAEENARIASGQLEKHTGELARLVPDAAVLSLAPAIRRLAAAAESLDQHRQDIAAAQIDVDDARDEVIRRAGQISAASAADEVVKQVPAPTDRAVIERQLKELDRAALELETHRKNPPQEQVQATDAAPALPSPEARTALGVARQEVDLKAAELRRLAALPGEIRAAERSIAEQLAALDLTDINAASRARPLMDADIDAALKAGNEFTTKRAGFEQRIEAITSGLSDADAARDQLLAMGAVPTREDVDAARARRDSTWQDIRRHYIDESRTDPKPDNTDTELPAHYEHSVQQADSLVDDFTSDQERAAQLQAANANIRTLENDRASIKAEVEALDGEVLDCKQAWNSRLAAANLPAQEPAALREWQARLFRVGRLSEDLQKKRDELEQVQVVEQGLAARLRQAITATGLAAPSEHALLSTLSATANEVSSSIARIEKQIEGSTAAAGERQRQKQQWQEQEAVLQAASQSAQDKAGPTWNALLLPDRTDTAVARSRLAEFDDLSTAQTRQRDAQNRLSSATRKLQLLAQDAEVIRNTLSDPLIADLRLYIDSVLARLAAAESIDQRRQLAQQAADTATLAHEQHESTAARHRGKLQALCRSAAVDTPVLLPEAEDRSRRKSQAQAALDKTREQLAQASRRSTDELRDLLSGRASSQLNADEEKHAGELATLQESLPRARERETQASRALDAVDSSDAAAAAREAMEEAAAAVRNSLPQWTRSRLAHALLAEALRRFRDRAQGPMLAAASQYFGRMTRGEFTRLLSDDSEQDPVLVAERRGGLKIRVEAMSEGTRDQLYLALRLAALDLRRAAGVHLPVVLDDVLMTSDEDRAGAALEALADFGRSNQVIVFTHHLHVVDLAGRLPAPERIAVVEL